MMRWWVKGVRVTTGRLQGKGTYFMGRIRFRTLNRGQGRRMVQVVSPNESIRRPVAMNAQTFVWFPKVEPKKSYFHRASGSRRLSLSAAAVTPQCRRRRGVTTPATTATSAGPPAKRPLLRWRRVVEANAANQDRFHHTELFVVVE